VGQVVGVSRVGPEGEAVVLSNLLAVATFCLVGCALLWGSSVLPAEANRLASEDGAGNGCRPCGSSPDPHGESPTTDTEAKP
jgi:hypothetical protein